MASKRRNMFHKNKTQETTENEELPGPGSTLQTDLNIPTVRPVLHEKFKAFLSKLETHPNPRVIIEEWPPPRQRPEDLPQKKGSRSFNWDLWPTKRRDLFSGLVALADDHRTKRLQSKGKYERDQLEHPSTNCQTFELNSIRVRNV
ncbi:hypothetical protein AAG570_009504 [Ranatra chinensis]|uniref:Uncharacterized protein n=1 Tax=Ranatra chinensis TaxID=642074 RepID=A0ABD0YP97_9HEMI